MSDNWETRQEWLDYCKDEGVEFDPVKTTIMGISDHLEDECKAYRQLIGGAYPDHHPDCVSTTEPEPEPTMKDGMYMLVDLPDGTTVSITVAVEEQ
jgi:hypothetical protein